MTEDNENKIELNKSGDDNSKDSPKTPDSYTEINSRHESLKNLFGLDKPVQDRGGFETVEKPSYLKAAIVILVSVAVIGGCIGMWVWGQKEIRRQEEAQYIAKKQQELEAEKQRRNQIEYADIAFLDSIPPNVDISMDGKKLYARAQNGGYTELRARESTWIRNLPIKESTVLQFGFSAEGFRRMTREVAYYDWYPSHKSSGNPLQKVFRKVVLEPDIHPMFEQCSRLPQIAETNPCEWTVFREIVFRERYAGAVSMLAPEDGEKRRAVKSLLERQPLLLQAARGFDLTSLDKPDVEIPAPELPDATKNLVKTLMDHPYGLYGAITIETDSPDTRVFFMGEPMMLVKDSGSMSQVKVQPGAPYTFAVYGQGRPISITDKLSVRLETDGAPAYVTEISPHQWHCTVPDIEMALNVPAPAIPPEINSSDYRQYLCTYSIKVSVNFAEIKALEEELAKSRETASAQSPVSP